METTSLSSSTNASKQANNLCSQDIIKIKPAIIVVTCCLLIWFSPPPTGLSIKAWHLFAIFLSTVLAIIVKPLPMGALAILSITTCTITQTISIDQALSSFSSKIVWLILIAFLLARGFIKTGLGARFAYYFVYLLGKNTLGLSYGLIVTELILAPFIPSNTARGAGIIFPIVTSLSKEYNSHPDDNTQNKIGAYLIKICFQANIITSAMFMTAMAANPLIASLAESIGYTITWMSWAKAAVVPGIINLLILPLVIYTIYPPEIKQSPQAKSFARTKLSAMGKLKTEEIIMLLTFSLLLVLWIFGDILHIQATTAALSGLSVLLISGVLNWDDILNEKNAWNTLIWLTTLLMMTTHLSEFGMMEWFSKQIHQLLASYPWPVALICLTLIYFYIHYLFASLTAHITSMFSTFALVAILSGAPIGLSIMLLAFLSTLSASITHYGTGTAPVYFGAGYVNVKDWWKIGGIISIINILLWTSIGGIWWKIIGIW